MACRLFRRDLSAQYRRSYFIVLQSQGVVNFGETDIPNPVNVLVDKYFGMEAVTVSDDGYLRTRDAEEIGKVGNWLFLHSNLGRFEWGPRALGSRSIVADPRRADMKDIINAKIKFREPFRPFAPVILEEAVSDYFDIKHPKNNYMVRYMLTVEKYKDGTGQDVPAVNHLGTGRMQSMRREWNPRYYELIDQFRQATGVPILVNTSFNLRGEPIVNTPANALKTFGNSGIDMLIMGDYIVRK